MEQIGCIVQVKDFSIIDYKFLSLLKVDDRKEISGLAQRPERLETIVKFDFDNYPISSMHKSDILFFTNKVSPDENIKDTSVIKLHTDTLICHVIYQSKF